uniref:Putative terminase n=1 Tax=viral metagenome TaxID=1070528 RepID=A0A6M3J762_9ZZZZ
MPKARAKTIKTPSKRDKTISNADIYAKSVINGDIVTNKWVKLACKRYLSDLENADKLGIYFDDKAATRAVKFFSCLKHSKGEWAGTEFKLELWQEFIIWNLFGWKRVDNGFRRFRTAYLEVSRKNGKTTLVAGLGLYLFIADNEPGAEIYSAATKKEQAQISHSEAMRMVNYSPMLKSKIGVYRNNLHCTKTNSKFEPLGADADTTDGLNISGAIVDELHAHKTRDLFDRIVTATGSRRQPLIVSITTAGFDKHSVCWEQHAYTERILEGTVQDESFFGIIYSIDKDDSWEDETVWIKANPNLNISVKADDLRRKAKRAKEIPSEVNTFMRMHMDIWTESVTRWISVDRWDACNQYPIYETNYTGRTCYGGLDLSTNIDISALVLVFPPENYYPDKYEPLLIEKGDKRFKDPVKREDNYVNSLMEVSRYEGCFDVLCRFFIPGDNIADRVRRDRVNYDVWVRQGLIIATPGNVIDYSFILNQIDKDAQQFDLKEIAFDRWGATKIIQDIQDMGFEKPTGSFVTERHLIDFGQGFASMSAPTKELEKLILGKRLNHGGNPILKWMASNVVVKIDPAGNVKIDKGQSVERVDGIVALVMAISRAVLHKESEMPLITML